MKKTILTVCLSIYLTLATVAAVVFGWLYFSGGGGQAFSLTDAKSLATRVYESFGFENNNAASSNALEYETFDGDLMEETWKNSGLSNGGLFSPWTAQLHLSIVKSTLNSLEEGFDQNAIFKSKVEYHQGSSVYYRDTYYVKIKLNKSGIVATAWVNNEVSSNASYTSATGAGAAWIVDIKQTSTLGWELNSHVYRKDVATEIGNNASNNKVFMEYGASADEQGKIYRIEFANVEFTSAPTLESAPQITKENISKFNFLEANSKTKKKLNCTQSTLQDADLISQTQSLVTRISNANTAAPNLAQKSSFIDKTFANDIFEDCFGTFTKN